jgi:hypothetical protein
MPVARLRLLLLCALVGWALPRQADAGEGAQLSSGLVFFQAWVNDLGPSKPGALVEYVLEGGGAGAAGVKAGDLVVSLGRRPVANAEEAFKAWRAAAGASHGECVPVTLTRTELQADTARWRELTTCVVPGRTELSSDQVGDLVHESLPTVWVSGRVRHPGIYLLERSDLDHILTAAAPIDGSAEICIHLVGPSKHFRPMICGRRESLDLASPPRRASYKVSVDPAADPPSVEGVRIISGPTRESVQGIDKRVKP